MITIMILLLSESKKNIYIYVYIKQRNWRISLFPRSGEKWSNFLYLFLFIYLIYFHQVQNIVQHLLFARNANTYLILLAAL